MSMFRVPVGDLLESYSWDSRSFSFSWEVYDGYMEDLRFLDKLEFSIEIITLDTGVHVIFRDLFTKVEYSGNTYSIEIPMIERDFYSRIDPSNDPDDIRPIEGGNIDLWPVLREEIIMATHTI